MLANLRPRRRFKARDVGCERRKRDADGWQTDAALPASKNSDVRGLDAENLGWTEKSIKGGDQSSCGGETFGAVTFKQICGNEKHGLFGHGAAIMAAGTAGRWDLNCKALASAMCYVQSGRHRYWVTCAQLSVSHGGCHRQFTKHSDNKNTHIQFA